MIDYLEGSRMCFAVTSTGGGLFSACVVLHHVSVGVFLQGFYRRGGSNHVSQLGGNDVSRIRLSRLALGIVQLLKINRVAFSIGGCAGCKASCFAMYSFAQALNVLSRDNVHFWVHLFYFAFICIYFGCIYFILLQKKQ